MGRGRPPLINYQFEIKKNKHMQKYMKIYEDWGVNFFENLENTKKESVQTGILAYWMFASPVNRIPAKPG